MGRRARIPEVLRQRPFTLQEAAEAGVTRYQLRGASWRRVGPSTYAWTGLGFDPLIDIAAAALRVPPTSAFSGLTAAWLAGVDFVAPAKPVEVALPHGCGEVHRSGLRISRRELLPGEVVLYQGWRATRIERTLFDLSHRLSLTEAVVIADAALHRGLVGAAALEAWAERMAALPGVVRFREVVSSCEPLAESPMETRLRLLLVRGGLPRPAAQVPLYDRLGGFLGRVDLYYPAWRLAVEYDGEQHRDSLIEDNRRQNNILLGGFRLLRFTNADLRNPERIVAQVRATAAAAA